MFASSLSAACSTPVSTPPILVRLTNESFATSGSNLFNCGSPAMPPDVVALASDVIACTPSTNPDGSYSATPVTVDAQLACNDGHGALVVVTCAGVAGTKEVSGTVGISITESCNAHTLDTAADTFSYPGLVPGMAQGQGLSSCATFSNLCSTNNPCGFNAFSLTASVGYATR